MSILVYPYNEQEERALLEFLKSRHYHFKSTDDTNVNDAFLDQYNKELDEANAQIEAGEYISHDDVKKFLAERRKRLSGIDWADDEQFVKELDERVERWESGIDRGYSWDEVEAEIQARRAKRSK